MSNFKFLEKIDTNLFQIIADAEKLYRDEYFEQSIVQTRRFAENVCRNLLGERVIPDSTFDECLATLQDIYTKNIRQRELIDDLYFLKKQGNASAHGAAVKQDGNIALDCIKRAFEIAINYAITNCAPKKVEKLEFSEEVLIMGEKKKKSSLKEKYIAKKKTAKKNNQIYKKKKEQAKQYVYPSLIENRKSAHKINFIGGLVLILSIIMYIYITFFLK
ncbi:MAG: hypothetical protein NC200_06625 [Candidatus Gastranaerophilales bacterium]|nr:hypothetical protein [Candidatus Gastranaerophilales bacterium]